MSRHWIALGAACLIVGCASTAQAPARKQGAPVAATPAGCVNQTGSLIPQPAGACAGFGHSYSRTDIDHTGRTTVAGALGELDPSITVQH